ncbi:RHS repeat domain-containing protein [Apibacter sp. ESL0404]|uniref:RHS repeat domain-containing protein n=1 Tax=Apibacter sp. ESL0404 TaxID=2704651 RepID=UPI002107BBE1|nr:RHS repeat-associated core domain-containing protein [Apibacter sp. ESL0404]
MLTKIKGSKAYSYDYVNKIGYDKFEQRNYLKYCNGSETTYTYDPERRRLSDLQVWVSPKTQRSGVRTQIINNKYTYDAVSNVLSVSNQAPLPQDNKKTMGGQMQHDYAYDGLYRLVQAQGSYTGADNKTAAYSLQMGYDNLHNIVSKNQQVSQQGIMIEGGLKAGYNLSYTYDSTKKNQIKTVQDINYREEESQEEEKRQEHKNYHYDLNGNLTYVNVELEKKDLRKTSQTQERKLRWDEENRLMAIDDNGYVSNYVYDASGERVIKTSGESEQVYINSLFSGGYTETQGFTAYINPYLVVSPNGKYTKHYYAGSQRIVSKLGDIESFGADPRRIEYAGSSVPGVTINWKAKYQRSIEDLKGNYAYFEVPYNGKDNDDYVNGEGFCCSQNTALRAGIGIGNVNYEKMQYYYHPDHLGSSSYITNLDGEIVQHVEYVPFGEVFIEERNNSWNTPYLFNGKELDEETGLYYYGARYYNPRESVWLSTDPLSGYNPVMEVEHYIDGQHNGGVYNSFNLNTYGYCYQNPVLLVDPNGKQSVGAAVGKVVGRKFLGEKVGGIIGGILDIPTTVLGAVLHSTALNQGEQEALDEIHEQTLKERGITLLKSEDKGESDTRSSDLGKLKEGSEGQKTAKKLQKEGKDGKLPTPDNEPDQFKPSKSDGGKIHKKTGAIYRRSNTTHRGKEGEFKIWPKGTRDFGKTSKTTGKRITTDQNGKIIGH